MKKNVVLYKALSAPLMAKLAAETDVTSIPDPTSAEGLARLRDALPHAHGLLGASLRIDEPLLALAPQLQVVASVSVGVDKYDVAAFDRHGVLLTNTPDVLTETTADTGFALLMATARRVVELAGLVRHGQWHGSIGPAQFGTDVHGKTLGIVGMGRIGQALAQRGHFGFGMPVLYHSHRAKPSVDERFGARHCALHALLRDADFVCLTVPLTAETKGLIGAHELSLMKPSAILVNIARGPVVDEAALIDALQNGRLRGAGLDVFSQEPVATDSPLLRLDNVVPTPHIGSATQETREAMAACAVENLLAALRAERPKDLVNPQAWRG
ncbi:NAD(P)-dependent oxidoreductase [Pseudomonas typographi]|uniref:Bifunctional glyoxylate/hydroxypyruvate reductase B n=1 Tax=Pseudomonas typographi TaxID=2715964 RepID=A0ABR7Z5X2_9PSED|nr:NAD(P)-dependent oxidoreductase [Pseudomonas typographi]MBD1554191.1 bifunctional glyoxylate/hydroxypyruvate reductase B [Pseudomonas typographi]MBD1589447.1 bifunctional glyoxylate/hydroxypyruvate reductase B [Pseudomonas typographi]MBD1600696.1 bifunctional glyoxylate/hydroxypyruvate reductase B [Pseudomonas typographi]